MDAFVDTAAFVLPILGGDLFRRRQGPQAAVQGARVPSAGAESTVFTFATGGASATAQETDDGFIVFSGSTARRTASGTFPAGHAALREKLIGSGQLRESPSPDLLVFATDVTFSSPSAAASIVSARSASGPLEWKVQPQGLTYRDWRTSRIDGTT